jgi:hypothetical protein
LGGVGLVLASAFLGDVGFDCLDQSIILVCVNIFVGLFFIFSFCSMLNAAKRIE